MKCPDCNKEIDETLNIEAMELTNRRLLSAQIVSSPRHPFKHIGTQNSPEQFSPCSADFDYFHLRTLVQKQPSPSPVFGGIQREAGEESKRESGGVRKIEEGRRREGREGEREVWRKRKKEIQNRLRKRYLVWGFHRYKWQPSAVFKIAGTKTFVFQRFPPNPLINADRGYSCQLN